MEDWGKLPAKEETGVLCERRMKLNCNAVVMIPKEISRSDICDVPNLVPREC